jgi:polyisoprenoid-binding protein YceI
MKKLSIKKLLAVGSILLATSVTSTVVVAQSVYQSQAVDILLSGTSNIHDWTMKAKKGTVAASFTVDAHNKITTINNLSFTIPAKNLKSEHTGMDNNTYKALNTDKNPNITFVATSSTVTPTGGNTYQINCQGRLTIAGTTKPTELVATGRYNPSDNSFTVTGVKKMKMTDYNVKPPTALLGTIKTGNEIAITYNVKFIK